MSFPITCTLAGQRAHLLVIDESFTCDAVRYRVVQQAGEVDGRAVREMPALRQIHTEERVPGLHEREEHGRIG